MKAYEIEVSKPDSDEKIIRKFAAGNAKEAKAVAEKIGFIVHDVKDMNPEPEKKKASKVEAPAGGDGNDTPPAGGEGAQNLDPDGNPPSQETPTGSGDSTKTDEGSKDEKPVEPAKDEKPATPAKPKAKAAKKAAKPKA